MIYLSDARYIMIIHDISIVSAKQNYRHISGGASPCKWSIQFLEVQNK